MNSEMPYFRLVHHEVYCICWSSHFSFLYNTPFLLYEILFYMSPFIFILLLAVTVIELLVLYIINNNINYNNY